MTTADNGFIAAKDTNSTINKTRGQIHEENVNTKYLMTTAGHGFIAAKDTKSTINK